MGKFKCSHPVGFAPKRQFLKDYRSRYGDLGAEAILGANP